MSLPTYDLAASTDHLSFEFSSDGPKGTIKKVIHFTKLKVPEAPQVYNLGFGDFNEVTKKIDDRSISDNHDRSKILGTVANSVLHLFKEYPNAQVAFQGSTPARTRLYTIEISKNWSNVKNLVFVEGLTTSGWEPFQKDRRYTALLITPRNS